MRQSRLAEMHLVVNGTRNQEVPCCIDDFHCRRFGADIRTDLGNEFSFNKYVTFKDGASALSGPLSGKLRIVLDLNDKPWYETSVGNDFVASQLAPVQVSGTIYFTQE